MVLRGAISVSLLICFTSASPARQIGEPVPGQAEGLSKIPLEQLPVAPLQSKEVIPDPAKSEPSLDVPSAQHLQADPESDTNSLPVVPSEGKDLNVNGNEADIQVPTDLSGDQGFSNEFVKKLLRGFFDELKKRPDLVEQILRYETLKELTRIRPETMFLPSDVMMANLQELNSQPVEEAPKLDTLTQSGTQSQTQALTQQERAAGPTNAQTVQTLTQLPDAPNEAASKRDSSAGNSTVAGSQDQRADGKAQIETPKSKGDNHMPTAPLQDPFYYYFYYPDDEIPAETDVFSDTPASNNMNNGDTPSSEDAVVDKLAKSVLAVIQYGLESNNNNNSNNINENTNKNNMSLDKGDNAQTQTSNQEEKQDNKAIQNSEEETNAHAPNKEEDELSMLARTSGD